MSVFPIPAPASDGRSRVAGIEAVFAWLRFGWTVFAAHPGLWAMSALILIAGLFVLMLVPLVGSSFAGLLTPILAAGLLAMCRQAAGEGKPGLSDLAAGFMTRPKPLAVLGVIFIIATLIIKLAVFHLFSSLAGGLMTQGLAGLGILGGWIILLLFSSLLLVPLWMVMCFASALVLFNDMPPVEACKAGFAASLKNILSFLILGLIVFVLCFFAALPVGLGFLVLIPVLAGTAYASYQDVFLAH
ncbi:MAG: hypothetical protein LBU46_00905 [Candidatus Accumulibacter sp.]|jgi:uncharacterized membrane protein|nr:hypothetical protein [Accumulibacter sp.]